MEKNDNTQERILCSARKVFMLKGMAGARMQDIADEAGINKAMLHYYFRSKEILFEMIFEQSLAQFFPRITGIIDAEIPFFEKIEKFCGAYLAMLQQNPYLPLFVLNEVNQQPDYFREKFWQNKDYLFLKFAELVEKEIESGNIKPVKPAHLFLNMISLCIFPYIAKPMFIMSSGMDELQFRYFIEQRKTEVAKFIIESIKK
jgi:AcrR family transcriptional regulator